MVRTVCKGSAGVSKPPSPGRPVRPRLLLFLELVLKNKRTYEGGWTSSCSTESTTSPPQEEMEKYLLMPSGRRPKLTWAPPFFLGHLKTWRIQYHYRDDQEYTRAWHPDLPITSMAPEKSLDPLRPEPTYGALDPTAEPLAKLLTGSEDLDVTALSEAVIAKLGIPEPLPKPALLSPSPGLSTLADDLKRSRVSRLLPKVTCPSPFHSPARTVPIAELQDLPVMETEKRRLSALASLAGVSPSPSGLTPGGGKMGRPIAQANIQLEVPEFDQKNLPKWAEEFAEFLLLTGQSHVDVATKCSLLKRSC